MEFNFKNGNDIILFKDQSNYMIENEKICNFEEIKLTRTNQQNRARWKYLNNIAVILNERGWTLEIPNTQMEVKYTKDNLYEMYWQSLRQTMYPGKTKQLDTKEFSELVEMVKMMFAKIFSINIPFPNWKDKTREEL